jgi:predicted nucleic acid-binding protein
VRETILLDTGPLVALLDRRTTQHDWSVAQFGQARSPLLTCESVLSEAMFLLQHVPNGCRQVTALVQRRVVQLAFRLDQEFEAVTALLIRYRDQPMSLADGCLVRMAEQFKDASVLTLDSDFLVYRKNGRQVIPTIMPEHE